MAITEETTSETTTEIEISASEEAFIIASENKGKSYFWTLICCHNVTPTISPIWPNPSAAYSVYNVLALLDVPFVALTEMIRFPILLNPTLEVNIYESSPILITPNVDFFMWDVFPYLTPAIKSMFVVNNTTPLKLVAGIVWTLNIYANLNPTNLYATPAHPNLYNQSPTLNSSVVNS
jgi:hypothetical protein